jgi:CrcB protein
MTPIAKFAAIAAAGGLGALARYALSGLAQRAAGAAFPIGTLAVNAVGCLAFGFVWALSAERSVLSPEARTIVLVGFMGAFTTFSTFAFETAQLARESEWALAGLNVLAQNALAIAALVLGVALGRAA